MKMEMDEKELRNARDKSVAVAVDAFFSWLSAHRDAQDIFEGSEWEFYQSQFLDSLKHLTRVKRDQMLERMRGR